MTEYAAIAAGIALIKRANKAIEARKYTDRPGAEWFVKPSDMPEFEGMPSYNGVYATARLHYTDDGTAYEVTTYTYQGDAVAIDTRKTLDAAFKLGKRLANARPVPAEEQPQAAPAPQAPEVAHGYTWADVREVQAADLAVGDVFITPGMGTGYYTYTDGSAKGAGWAELDGTAWTVTARDGMDITAVSHTGKEAHQTPREGKRVLRVTPVSRFAAPQPAPQAAPAAVEAAVEALEAAPDSDAGKVLTREPWRGSQICGYQLTHTTWTERESYCGERKAPGLYACTEHDADMRMEFGEVRMAPGNARGVRIEQYPHGWSAYSVGWDVDGSDDELIESADDRATLERSVGIGVLLWEGEDGEPVQPTPEEVAAYAPQDADSVEARREVLRAAVMPKACHYYNINISDGRSLTRASWGIAMAHAQKSIRGGASITVQGDGCFTLHGENTAVFTPAD